jgi:hypothetical protein
MTYEKSQHDAQAKVVYVTGAQRESRCVQICEIRSLLSSAVLQVNTLTHDNEKLSEKYRLCRTRELTAHAELGVVKARVDDAEEIIRQLDRGRGGPCSGYSEEDTDFLRNISSSWHTEVIDPVPRLRILRSSICNSPSRDTHSMRLSADSSDFPLGELFKG